MEGFIKLFRKFKEWEWYKDGDTKDVFIHILISANHKAAKWNGISIAPGELITSRAHLAADLNISERRVRTSLNHLKSTNEIATESTSKYTRIKVLKWADYQVMGDDSDQANDQPKRRRPTSDRPATDQQPTTNKNDKNDKNEKKNTKDPLNDGMGKPEIREREEETKIGWGIPILTPEQEEEWQRLRSDIVKTQPAS